VLVLEEMPRTFDENEDDDVFSPVAIPHTVTGD
jgi:hypothetical protein